MIDKEYKRKDEDPPLAIEKWGWRYHHLGIPTKDSIPGETYLPAYKCYFGPFDKCPMGIQWMRFDDDCTMHELIKTLPHIAFEVDNLDLALQQYDFNILTKPNSPGQGIRVAMIEHNGAPVELIEFENNVKLT